MTEAQEKALETLQVFDERRLLYDLTNRAIKNLNPDFPQIITMIDAALETSMLKVLDAVLGDEIASYYVNEVPFMKGSAYIIEPNGVKWPIISVDDVRAYVARPPS